MFVQFGTFPFRQSQISQPNHHQHGQEWANRISASFRSVGLSQVRYHSCCGRDVSAPLFHSELWDVRCGIIGSDLRWTEFQYHWEHESRDLCERHHRMWQNESGESVENRFWRFIVLDWQIESLSGDRIVALTICFESIVYEDALTILSYASPYPVCSSSYG